MRSCRFFLLYVAMGLVVISYASVCRAALKMVDACGIASIVNGNISRARTMALQNAQRNAVEMGLGTVIDSQTMVQNDQLIRDRIYSQSSGYVKNYSILSEGHTPIGNTYEVCLRAKVQLANIKDDLRALGILRQQVGNRRFIIVYVPRRHVSLPGSCRAVVAAEQAVNEAFIRKGFLVLDKDLVRDVQREIGRSGRASLSLDAITALALKKAADLLLVLDVGSAKRTELTNEYFAEVSFDVSLEVVALATAEIIASLNDHTNVRTARRAIDDVNENPISETKIRQLASNVAESVLGDTVAYFGKQVYGGTRYSCLFKNFDENEIFTIVGLIENLSGFKGKYVRNASFKDFEIDVNYLGKKFDFQRKLYEVLRQNGIYANFQKSNGNTLCLIKKRR